MKIGIMQPYFFPYLGYFSLIAHTDCWVVFDITQYTQKSWMNRNRILHPNLGWNYITVPLTNASISIKTREARVLDLAATRKSILGKISHYKRKAPHFDAVEALVNEVFSVEANDSLVHLNVRSLSAVCRYLGIPFNHYICSEMDIPLPEFLPPGQWAVEIASHFGATDYVNPIGGRQLFDPANFSLRGIALHFLDMEKFTYDVRPYQFEENLSILDVLMWNEPKTILEAIHRNTATFAVP